MLEQLAANDAYDVLLATTKTVFFQAAAPTGWTKDAANNDAALRVVSGSGGGTGGSTGLASHNHPIAADGGHTHASAGVGGSFGDNPSNITDSPTHTHGDRTGTAAIKYADVLVCGKDSGGYASQVGSWPYKTLITTTLAEQLATNDAFKHLDSGVWSVFFQAAAPTGWTKSTANTDAALRVVSGTGGGTGGSVGFASHTHSISSGGGHTHSNGGAGDFNFNASGNGTDNAGAHDHGGATGASNFKYIDTIVCSKD